MKNGQTPAPADDLAELGDHGVDFSQFFTVMREHLWLIVLFIIVGGLAGLGYVARMPRTYLATTVMEINGQPMKLLAFDGVQPGAQGIPEIADKLVAGMKNRAFLHHVVQANKLTTDPLFLPPLPDGQPHSTDTAVNALLGSVAIVARRGTPFVEVSAMHADPRVAARLADALADEWRKQDRARRSESSSGGIQFLVEKAEKLKGELEGHERALNEYTAKPGNSSLDQKQDVVITRLKTLAAELDGARGARIRLESDSERVKQLAGTPEKMLEIASVFGHPTIAAAQSKIEGVEAVIAAYELRYTEKHYKMKEARSQLDDANRNLREALAEMPQLINASLEAAKQTEAKFAAALKEQDELAKDLNEKSVPYNDLAHKVSTHRALYDAMLKRLGEAQIATGVEQEQVTVFEKALLPASPMQPPKSKIIAIGLAAGLATGIALAFALHALDSSIRTVEQATRVTGLQVLGAVPRDAGRKAEARAITMHLHPASPVAEAFRSLRASLQVVPTMRGRHIVAITSAEPDEGKTFCAINTAIAFAQQGLRTLLIDADLRVSMVGRMIVPDATGPGVTDFLEGRVDIGGAIQRTEVPNLCVMTAGTPAKQPAELLAGPVFGELLRTLRAEFDRIVIDTVPVLAVADVLLLGEHSELVCLVVRAAKTSRKCVLRARDMLVNAGCKPAGIVLNQLVFRSGSGYNRYIGKYGAPENYGKDRKKDAEEDLEEETPVART
jgi:capsular exopolysaccharide synthesis family protein